MSYGSLLTYSLRFASVQGTIMPYVSRAVSYIHYRLQIRRVASISKSKWRKIYEINASNSSFGISISNYIGLFSKIKNPERKFSLHLAYYRSNFEFLIDIAPYEDTVGTDYRNLSACLSVISKCIINFTCISMFSVPGRTWCEMAKVIQIWHYLEEAYTREGSIQELK